MSRRVVVNSLVAITALAGFLSCMTQHRDCLRTNWLWAYVPIPSRAGDGFATLHKALSVYASEGSSAEDYRDLLTEAAGSADWSGHPMVERLITGDMLSANLISNGRETVDYSVLWQSIRDTVNYIEKVDGDRGVGSVRGFATTLITLGYQLSRNGEDTWIGQTRLLLWDEGFRILAGIGDINEENYEIVQTTLAEGRRWVRERDPNRLYLVCEE